MDSLKISKGLLAIYAIFLNPIIFKNMEMVCYLIIYGLPIIYFVLHTKEISLYTRYISFYGLLLLFGFFILLCSSAVVPYIKSTNDYTYVNTVMAILRKFIIIFFLLFITKKKYPSKNLIDLFALYFSLGTVLYVCGSIFLFLIPNLKGMWLSLLNISEKTNVLFSNYGYALRFGWSGFSGYRSTLDCSIAIVFLCYLYFSKKSTINLKTSRFTLFLILCFLGNLFYGRIGIVVSVIVILIGLVCYHKIDLKFIAGIFVFLLFLILCLMLLRNKSKMVNDWFLWMSTPFFNLIKTGSFNNYSVDNVLNKMIFLPSSKTIIFGDGMYTDRYTGSYYMNTDVGFMRQILFWGIGFTILSYVMTISTILKIKSDRVLHIMLLALFIIFEIKGEVYYEILPMMFAIFFATKRKNGFS